MQRFRPLGLGDIFDEAFDLYKRNLPFLLLVAVVIAAPLQALISLVTIQFLHQFLGIANAAAGAGSGTDPFQLLSGLSTSLTSLLAATPFYLFGWALEWSALAAASSAFYMGEKPTLWSVYRTPLKRFVPLLLTALLVAAALLAGMALCGLCFPLAATLFLFTAHTFTLEGKAYGGALGRSSALVSGHGWRVFGCLCALGVLMYALSMGIQFPLVYLFDTLLNIAPGSDALFGGSGAGILDARQQAASQVSAGLANLALTPFALCVVTVLYFDLRIRKEGFDIELLARDLGYRNLQTLGGYLPAAPVFLATRLVPPTIPTRRKKS